MPKAAGYEDIWHPALILDIIRSTMKLPRIHETGDTNCRDLLLPGGTREVKLASLISLFGGMRPRMQIKPD